MITLRSKRLALLALLLTSAASAACRPTLVTQSAPPALSAGRHFPSIVHITNETAADLREIAVIEDAAGHGPVLALLMTPDE